MAKFYIYFLASDFLVLGFFGDVNSSPRSGTGVFLSANFSLSARSFMRMNR